MRSLLIGDGKPRRHGRWIYRSVTSHPDACQLADREEVVGMIHIDPTKLVHWQPCGKGFTYWAAVKKETVSESSSFFRSITNNTAIT